MSETAISQRVIRLGRGQTRSFLCGERVRSQLHVILRDSDSLLVTCRETQEVVMFRCEGGTGRRHFLTIPRNTRVTVTCRG